MNPNPDPDLSSPVHPILLVVNGVHVVEKLELDELAFVLQPLKIQGGTDSTVAPVAIR